MTVPVDQREEVWRGAAQGDAATLSKSHFLAMMTHELRTPLNAIIGFSEAIQTSLHQDQAVLDREGLAEFSTAIREAGEHLLGVINNILDVARLESGNLHLADDVIDVFRLAEDSLRLVAPVARVTGISLDLAIKHDIPRIRGDERQLRQVFGHLLGNAVKFTPPGGQVVLAAGTRVNGDLEITVRDSGIGIPVEDIERVFEPFSQVDNGLTRRATGAGIGLYFCRAVLKAHGGSVSLHSPAGQGTTVRVVLPASRLRQEAGIE